MLTATPGSENVPVEGTCFQSAEVSSKALKSGDVEVTLHLGLPTSLLCHASFVLATDKHIELEEVASSNPSKIRSIKTNQIRFIRFPIQSQLCFSSGCLATTPLLFRPLPTQLPLRIGIFTQGDPG